MKVQARQVAAITVAEAQRRLGVSLRTVYYWLDNGKLTEATTQDGAVRLVAVDRRGEIIIRKEA